MRRLWTLAWLLATSVASAGGVSAWNGPPCRSADPAVWLPLQLSGGEACREGFSQSLSHSLMEYCELNAAIPGRLEKLAQEALKTVLQPFISAQPSVALRNVTPPQDLRQPPPSCAKPIYRKNRSGKPRPSPV